MKRRGLLYQGKVMENDTLIRKIHMLCPLCDKTHEIEAERSGGLTREEYY